MVNWLQIDEEDGTVESVGSPFVRWTPGAQQICLDGMFTKAELMEVIYFIDKLRNDERPDER